ncbi:hypothetical protein [Paenibacillus mendelii]|uniref:Uncharacterized protein n=1 Tax=Paenibacillus mendelii TaxID=206163 RepID=A0ABV6J656_9BACL|nr:hypothetical protein [Paenibacillus mendelii]MCQ6559941.1 hypothetical protein [Paenibacillus mendelii]
MAVWGYVWYALFLCWGISLGFAAFFEGKMTKTFGHRVINGVGSPR